MILDLTHTISPNMPVYPGTPAPRLFKASTLEQHGFRETQISMVSHTGTHMDAPWHMLPNGTTLDELPVSSFCGRAVVLDVSDRDSITLDYLKAQQLKSGTKLQFLRFYFLCDSFSVRILPTPHPQKKPDILRLLLA